MIDEKEMAAVIDANGAALNGTLLDDLWMSIDLNAGVKNAARIVSHSLQTLMYERAGYSFREVEGQRMTHINIPWRIDDSLPLNCVLLETEFGTGLIKDLYPFDNRK